MSSSRVITDMYGRLWMSDSMTRWGDDLCQLVLSMLPIADKFRLECVSKQWQRLIFTKVSGLNITCEDTRDWHRLTAMIGSKFTAIVKFGVQSFTLRLQQTDQPLTCLPTLRMLVMSCLSRDVPSDRAKANVTHCSAHEHMSDHFWSDVVQLAPNIRHFDLTIDDSTFIKPMPCLPSSATMTSLEELKISCFKIDRIFFIHIANFAPNLKVLDLDSRCQLTDDLFESLSQLKCLTKISLKFGFKGNSLTDTGVSHLINNCPKLEKIKFCFRSRITNKTIVNFKLMAKLLPKRTITFESFDLLSVQNDIGDIKVSTDMYRFAPRNIVSRSYTFDNLIVNLSRFRR